jgi:hypothetical protein
MAEKNMASFLGFLLAGIIARKGRQELLDWQGDIRAAHKQLKESDAPDHYLLTLSAFESQLKNAIASPNETPAMEFEGKSDTSPRSWDPDLKGVGPEYRVLTRMMGWEFKEPGEAHRSNGQLG